MKFQSQTNKGKHLKHGEGETAVPASAVKIKKRNSNARRHHCLHDVISVTSPPGAAILAGTRGLWGFLRYSRETGVAHAINNPANT